MSIWTHVAGVIRFENLDRYIKILPIEREKLPQGSEGGLQYHLWKNPDTNAIASCTAMIWGDLRDFSDSKEILSYFQKIIEDTFVRSGLLEVKVEGKETLVFHFDCSSEKWIEVFYEEGTKL